MIQYEIPPQKIANGESDASRQIVIWIIVASIFLSPLLAYSLPEKSASLWPSMAAFVASFSRTIPSISQIVAVSAFPELTRLFLSIQWGIAFPIYCFLFGNFFDISPAGLAMIKSRIRRWHFLFMPLAPIILVLTSLNLPLSGEPPYVADTPVVFIIRLMGESRLWLGLFGSWQAMLTAFALIALFKLPSLYRKMRNH